MKINNSSWVLLRKQIESLIEKNPEVSDVSINYQIRKTNNRNFIKLNIYNQ